MAHQTHFFLSVTKVKLLPEFYVEYSGTRELWGWVEHRAPTNKFTRIFLNIKFTKVPIIFVL